jgi:hypothetical protein
MFLRICKVLEKKRERERERGRKEGFPSPASLCAYKVCSRRGTRILRLGLLSLMRKDREIVSKMDYS